MLDLVLINKGVDKMEIKFDEKGHRAVALVDGKQIGECTFSRATGLWIIDHTKVDEEYEGQGIGKKLVDKVVEEARKKGIKLMATCPFALKLFQTSKEYEDVYKK